MTVSLILVALVLTAIARIGPEKGSEHRQSVPTSSWITLIVGVALAAILIAKFGPVEHRVSLLIGLAVGALVVSLGEFLGGVMAAIGIGLAGIAAVNGLPSTELGFAQMSFWVGTVIGVLAVARSSGLITSVLTSSLVAANLLGGQYKNVPIAIEMGTTVGVVGLVGILVATLALKRYPVAQPILTAVMVAGASWLLAVRMDSPSIKMVGMMGAVAGIVVHFLVSEKESDIIRIILAAIIALSVATITFSMAMGAGMALGFLSMVVVLIAGGNRTAILAIGPVLGLIFYRITERDSSRVLDISQHYALLGVVLGALVPLLPTEVAKGEKWKGAVVSLLWMVLLMSVPVFIDIMLGQKGAAGFIGGIGLAGICQAVRKSENLLPLAVAPGLVGVSAFSLKWFTDWGNLARDEKVKFLLVGGTAVAVLGFLLVLLSRNGKEQVAA